MLEKPELPSPEPAPSWQARPLQGVAPPLATREQAQVQAPTSPPVLVEMALAQVPVEALGGLGCRGCRRRTQVRPWAAYDRRVNRERSKQRHLPPGNRPHVCSCAYRHRHSSHAAAGRRPAAAAGSACRGKQEA